MHTLIWGCCGKRYISDAPFPLTVTGVMLVARFEAEGEAVQETARAPTTAVNVAVFMLAGAIGGCFVDELVKFSGP